jgi:DNA adenine methylase
LNDIDGDVVNFFRVLRDSPSKLIRQISLTPFSRAEVSYALSYRAEDPIERARCFYLLVCQTRRRLHCNNSGWRFGVLNNKAIQQWNKTSHLWDVAQRLKHVYIECDDALRVAQRYDTDRTLHYFDPPYVHSTRMDGAARKGYRYEMTDADHIRFLDMVRGLKGMSMISGYASGLYTDGLAGWRCIKFAGRSMENKKTEECLWLSPNCSELPMIAALRAAGAAIGD